MSTQYVKPEDWATIFAMFPTLQSVLLAYNHRRELEHLLALTNPTPFERNRIHELQRWRHSDTHPTHKWSEGPTCPDCGERYSAIRH